jgi:hypothetical protein
MVIGPPGMVRIARNEQEHATWSRRPAGVPSVCGRQPAARASAAISMCPRCW